MLQFWVKENFQQLGVDFDSTFNFGAKQYLKVLMDNVRKYVDRSIEVSISVLTVERFE